MAAKRIPRKGYLWLRKGAVFTTVVKTRILRDVASGAAPGIAGQESRLTAATRIKRERTVARLRVGGVIPVVDQRRIVIERLLILVQLGVVLHITGNLGTRLLGDVVPVKPLRLGEVIQEMRLGSGSLERCKLGVAEVVDFLGTAEIADGDVGRNMAFHQIHDVRVIKRPGIEDLVVGSLVHMGRGDGCRDLWIHLGSGGAAGAENKKAKRRGYLERREEKLHRSC